MHTGFRALLPLLLAAAASAQTNAPHGGSSVPIATAGTAPATNPTVQAPATPPQLPQVSTDSLNDWLRTAVGAGIRDILENTDHEQALQFLDSLLSRLQQEDAAAVAALRGTAHTLLPVLESYEETLPYALWLRTRLDYFEPPPARPAVTVPPSAAAPPPATVTARTVWEERLRDRPLPSNAPKHLATLRRIFEEECVPVELVWLAEVESSFDPRAKSPAGAAGLFQLMKPTAQHLGLSTWFPDERLDAEKNARAAARYLKQLHRRFGDWPLTLAAYNAGETRVATLLRTASRRTYEGIAARLPAETQMYVPKVAATLQRRESVELHALPPPKD